jgi:hypothetical protein
MSRSGTRNVCGTGTGDGISSAGRCTTGTDAGISFFSAGGLAVFWGSAISAGDASLLAFSGCVSTNCGFGEPASIESRASGGTASMSDFLFILVDLIKEPVDFFCTLFGSRQPAQSVYLLILLDSP